MVIEIELIQLHGDFRLPQQLAQPADGAGVFRTLVPVTDENVTHVCGRLFPSGFQGRQILHTGQVRQGSGVSADLTLKSGEFGAEFLIPGRVAKATA